MSETHHKQHQLSRTLFRSDLVEIGMFDCPRHYPTFRDTGPTWQYLVVFPRQAVKIQHDNASPVVANRQITTLYNHNQHYQREELSTYGDQSIWLRFRKAEVIEALIAAGRAHTKLEQQPFAWTHSHCDAQTYLLQRELSLVLVSGKDADFLQITEAALTVLQRVVNGIPAEPVDDMSEAKTATRMRHRRLVRHCEELLTTQFNQKLTLESIAAQLATTPFHLSRVFSRVTGKTIHQQLVELRVRCAVDRIIDEPGHRITDVGMDMGFATPSHFSQAFRKHFGITPRQFRK
jgi:AraC family transcriptional regulator